MVEESYSSIASPAEQPANLLGFGVVVNVQGSAVRCFCLPTYPTDAALFLKHPVVVFNGDAIQLLQTRYSLHFFAPVAVLGCRILPVAAAVSAQTARHVVGVTVPLLFPALTTQLEVLVFPLTAAVGA